MMGGVMQMAGGLVGAAGAMQKAEAEAEAHNYNAEVADRNRHIIAQQTAAAVRDQRSQNKREYHAIRTIYGASHIDMSGSALDVMRDTAIEQELDVSRIKYKGKLARIQEKDTANLERMGAQSALEAGKISAISSVIGGLSGAVSSFGSMIPTS